MHRNAPFLSTKVKSFLGRDTAPSRNPPWWRGHKPPPQNPVYPVSTLRLLDLYVSKHHECVHRVCPPWNLVVRPCSVDWLRAWLLHTAGSQNAKLRCKTSLAYWRTTADISSGMQLFLCIDTSNAVDTSTHKDCGLRTESQNLNLRETAAVERTAF